MPIQWNDVKKWLGDAADVTVRESRELARKGRIQVDIVSLRHQITRSLTELGSVTYDLVQKKKSETVHQDQKVTDLTAKIHDLELQLRRKEKERHTRKYT